jgi:hypothetical protein
MCERATADWNRQKKFALKIDNVRKKIMRRMYGPSSIGVPKGGFWVIQTPRNSEDLPKLS